MKKVLSLVIFTLFFNCTDEVIKKDEQISNIKLNITINNNENPIYHIYFKNTDNSNKSFGKNLMDKTNRVNLEIYPGNYKIYVLSLADKTSTTECVDKFNVFNYSLFNDYNLNFDLIDLKTEAKVINEDNSTELIINMEKLNEVFSLSSLSLKQGSDRNRSIDFTYNDTENFYYSILTLYQNGDWYLNISYSVKASAIEENSLKNDNIKISTSYFSNIYLGNYNYIIN